MVIALYFEQANILHMGDNYFNGMFPYVDIDGGGSLQGMIAAQTLALSMIDENTQVIPGHGDMSNKAELTASRDRLQGILDLVKSRIDAGKTLDEIIEENLVSDLAEFSAFINEEAIVKITHRSLTEK